MSVDFLNEAFKRLNKLNEDTFKFTDEGIAELTDMKTASDNDESVQVVDEEADTMDELKSSYKGNVILQCPVCKTNIFKKHEDVIIDADDEVANVEDICPYCGENSGFIVIGQIEAMDIEDTPINPVQERFKHRIKTKEPIKENLYKVTYFDTANPDETLKTKIRASSRQEAINKLLKHYDDFYIEDVKLLLGNEPSETKTKDTTKENSFAPVFTGTGMKAKNESVEDDNPLQDIRSNIIEFPNGDYVYVEYKDGKLIAGGATNTGIIPEYELAYDHDSSVDENLADLYDKILEQHPEYLDESLSASKIGDNSRGVIYDEVLKILGSNDYDTSDADVQNYAEVAAEYIEITRADSNDSYSVRQWFKDTKENYPEDLNGLKKIEEAVNSSSNVIMETAEGEQSLREYIDNNEAIYNSIQDRLKKLYVKNNKPLAYHVIYRMLTEIAEGNFKTNIVERTQMAKEEVDEYFRFQDAQKNKTEQPITESPSSNIIMETAEGEQSLREIMDNDEFIYKTIQAKIAKFYEQGKKDSAITAVRKILFEISRDYKLRTTIAERQEIAEAEVNDYFNFHDKNKNTQTPVVESEGLTEDLQDVSVETDTQKVTVKDGVTTIEDKSVAQENATENIEMITPVSDELKKAIIAHTDDDTIPVEDIHDESEEEEDDEDADIMDVDIDDIQEESFNNIGQKFLKTIYENVQDFKTTNATSKDNRLMLEGVIYFKSGAKKKTTFMFEAKDITKNNKVRFLGGNTHICKGKRPFMLNGYLQDKTIIVESLNYNFTTKDAGGQSTKVRGTVSLKG